MHGQRQLGVLAGQLAEALDDLAMAVENYRIDECTDPKVIQAAHITEEALRKARVESQK